ncbi:hypothetical protein [Bacteroides sp. 44_46]|nr:hypothetical protein [Bacteroides sp. 44_46]
MLVASDVARSHCENRDYKKEFANKMYQYGYGIAMHLLSIKIYQSSGETAYTDEEVNLMQRFAEEELPPFFIDALNHAIQNQPEECVTDK